MIGPNVVAFLDADAEQPAGDVEAGRDDVVELEIGLQVLLGEVEPGRPDPLGVIAPVPGRHGVVLAFGRRRARQFRFLLAGPRDRLFPYVSEQCLHRLGRLGHGVVELVGGKAFVSEQPRLFGAQSEDLGDQGPVVPPGALAAPRPGSERPLAQIAPLARR